MMASQNRVTHAQVNDLLDKLRQQTIVFNDVILFIESHYNYTPVTFKNGELNNHLDENQGSAKIFGFAKLNKLSKEDTLILFAEHYESVLSTPEADNHGNIRNFMKTGWDALIMDDNPLSIKTN